MKRMCPVCGKYEFEDDFDICDECGWQDDIVQLDNPDERDCANSMSLNEARKAYKEGKTDLIKSGSYYK